MKKNPKTSAGLYARISTNEVRQNLENQLGKLRDYCKRMQWKIAAEYTDRDSGARRGRPGLDALMAAAAKREFDIVLVFDLSRLTRLGPAEAFGHIERLQQSGVQFCSFTEEHFRTSGPAGALFIAIAAHIAQMERLTMKARILAGLERARKNGKKIGRPPGPELDSKKLQTLRQRGWSIRQLAAEFDVGKSTIERQLKGQKRWGLP